VTISFVMSVCLFAFKNLAPIGQIFISGNREFSENL